MSALRIRLLGTFQVALDERPLHAFRSDKTRALLAYLAVESDRPHRREALADLLWPNHGRADGLTNLRQTVFRLRQCLASDRSGAPFLLVATHDVQFNPASDHWLDVAELNARADLHRRHHPAEELACDECLASLAAAVALYRGPFLAGLSPHIGVDFDNWLIATQEALHWQVLEVLDLLGRGLEARGDYAEVVHHVHREIELEPYRESAHRRLMRALALSGQRGQALQQFAHYQSLLSDTVGRRTLVGDHRALAAHRRR